MITSTGNCRLNIVPDISYIQYVLVTIETSLLELVLYPAISTGTHYTVRVHETVYALFQKIRKNLGLILDLLGEAADTTQLFWGIFRQTVVASAGFLNN
jgi:hypothetical protein